MASAVAAAGDGALPAPIGGALVVSPMATASRTGSSSSSSSSSNSGSSGNPMGWRITEAHEVALLSSDGKLNGSGIQYGVDAFYALIPDKPLPECTTPGHDPFFWSDWRDRALVLLCRDEAAQGNVSAINNLAWITLFGIGERYDDDRYVLALTQALELSSGIDTNDAVIDAAIDADFDADPTDLTRWRSPFDVAINMRAAVPLFALAAARGCVIAANNIACIKLNRMWHHYALSEPEVTSLERLQYADADHYERVLDAYARDGERELQSLIKANPMNAVVVCNVARITYFPIRPFPCDETLSCRFLFAEPLCHAGTFIPHFVPAARVAGYMFREGAGGCTKDADKAIACYKAASDSGDTSGLVYYADALSTEKPVTAMKGWYAKGHDALLWRRHLMRAAHKPDGADAAYNLSRAFGDTHINDVPGDAYHDWRYAYRAATRGHVDAAYNLSYLCSVGRNANTYEYEPARTPLQLASFSGDAYHQANPRDGGHDAVVPVDRKRALLWFRRAAAQGHTQAFRELGRCHNPYVRDPTRSAHRVDTEVDYPPRVLSRAHWREYGTVLNAQIAAHFYSLADRTCRARDLVRNAYLLLDLAQMRLYGWGGTPRHTLYVVEYARAVIAQHADDHERNFPFAAQILRDLDARCTVHHADEDIRRAELEQQQQRKPDDADGDAPDAAPANAPI